MFKVKLNSAVLRKIFRHIKEPREQIGLLIGYLANDSLIVIDAACGEGASNDSYTVFSPGALAKVVDKIIKGKIRGNIVGWYHSHVGRGVFMSDVDVQTQLKLQQFSPYVIALVIDVVTGEFGIFSYDYRFGVVQFPEEQIEIL